MIKMIVSSFHNALLDEEEAIPTSTMLEIERIRKKRIAFSICTNRLYTEVLEYNRDFPFTDYIISLNGSYIYDVEKKKTLVKNKLSFPNIKKILNLFENYKIYYYTEDKVYESYQEIEDKDVYKLEIEIEEDKEQEKLSKLNVNTSIFIWNQKKYLEITSNRSNMFSGVDKVAIKLNIDLNEVIAIGSNDSDTSMIKAIPTSYIMKNSCSSLKEMGKKKTSSNNEKGVEKILQKI